MPSILFVCTGNICRSPMAMGLLRQRLAQRGAGDPWRVESAGTWAPEGSPASEHGVTVMAQRGIDISQHRARRVSRELLAQFDLILTMERGQAEALVVEFPEFAERIYMLSEMVGEDWDLFDPIGEPVEAYLAAADALEEVLDRGLERILELAQQKAARKETGNG